MVLFTKISVKIVPKLNVNILLHNSWVTQPVVNHKYISYTNLPSTYTNWQICKYGDVGELKLTEHENLPIINHKDEVLIKVHASSVNPIDVRILGY